VLKTPKISINSKPSTVTKEILDIKLFLKLLVSKILP
tara:strand:+ start:1583 stop:1693 length:111 start_codon:yes stop_codon:yes gene_type:complete